MGAKLTNRKFTLLLLLNVIVILCKSTVVSGDNLCNLCKCLNDGNYYVDIKCSNSFDMIYKYLQWPQTNRKIEAHFVNLNALPRFPYSGRVNKLSIRNSSLSYITSDNVLPFPNLERLDLSSNRILSIPSGLINESIRVTHLNLSRNFINNTQIENLKNIGKLLDLDLSYNRLIKFSHRLVLHLMNVKYLNFEGNEITGFNISLKFYAYQWRDLNLSKNKISFVTYKKFSRLRKLEYINFSHNTIAYVDPSVFKKLERLKKIDLSHNYLKSVSLELPQSVISIRLNNNNIRSWPFINLPIGLVDLHIQNNKLKNLLLETTERLPELRMLNASGNKLNVFPIVELPQLRCLDLSNNEFTLVPQNMWFVAPSLEILVLDYNPIVMVRFGRIFLTQLSMRYLPRLQRLEGNSFSSIEGQQFSMRMKHETCVDISITHCPELTEIDDNAFGKIALCSLDLSYNNLRSVSRKLTNWSNLESPIKLDGNPAISGLHP